MRSVRSSFGASVSWWRILLGVPFDFPRRSRHSDRGVLAEWRNLVLRRGPLRASLGDLGGFSCLPSCLRGSRCLGGSGQRSSNRPSDPPSNLDCHSRSKRESNGQSYGESHEDSDLDRNGQSDGQSNAQSSGESKEDSNSTRSRESNRVRNGESNSDHNGQSYWHSDGQSNGDYNWDCCGGNGGGEFRKGRIESCEG